MADLRNITSGTGFQNGAGSGGDTGNWTYRGTTNAGTPGAFGGTLDYPEQATIQAELDANRAFAVWFEYTGSDRDTVETSVRRWFADGGTLAGTQELFARDASGSNLATRTMGGSSSDAFRTYLWRGDAVPGFMYVALVITTQNIPSSVSRIVTEGQWNNFIWGSGVNHSSFAISDPTAGYTDFNFTLPVNITGDTQINGPLTVQSDTNLRDGLRVASTLVLEGYTAATEFDDSSLATRSNLRIDTATGFVYNSPIDASDANQYVDNITIEPDLLNGQRQFRIHYNTGGSELSDNIRNIVPRYFDELGDLPNGIASPPDAIGSTGQILRVEEVTGSDLVVRRRLNWADSLSVTEEGSTPISLVDNIVFDNRHFTVVDSGSGDVEVVLTASAAGGGASIQNPSGSTESPDPATIIAGGGLSLTVTDEGSATETARIDSLDVTLIGSAGSANINQLNVYSSPAGSGRSYTLPNVMSSGSSPERIIGDGDFLVLKNASTTADVTILTSALGVTHRIDGDTGNIVLSPGEILTLVYSESGSRNGDSSEGWVTTHRTIERQNLTVTDEDGTPTVTDPANLVFGDGLDLTVDTGTSTATVSLPFTPAPDYVNYTDLDVTLSDGNIGTADEGTSITISNVESDLDWQVGQLGYSYSGDLSTLFTFTVTATDLPAGEMTVDVDSVIRTSDLLHTRYLIFAGAPVGGTAAIPTLSTVEHTDMSTISNNRADVYTVNLVNTTRPIVLPFTTHLNDGDYVIVKAVGQNFNLLTSGGTLIDEDGIFRRLEDGDSMTLVYSDKRATGGGWYITSFFRANQPRYYRHSQSTAATEWTIDHTLTYRYPTITVYDNNNRVIIPEEITATSATRITITFPTAISGFATLVG